MSLSNDLIDHVAQLRRGIANHSTLSPGDEAVGTDEESTILLSPIGFRPHAFLLSITN
jgi:hypothetical protein